MSAARFVRALMIVTGRGDHMYSDRLKVRKLDSGPAVPGRSIKVLGWDLKTYRNVADLLRDHDFYVKVICRPIRSRRGEHWVQRLHVYKVMA